MSRAGEATSRDFTVLNEFSPIVSVKRAVGSHYSFVEFDYEAFAEEAGNLDIGPDAQGTLRVTIEPKRGLGLRKGFYARRKKQVMVTARPTVNKTMMHELTHVAQDINGENLHGIRYGIGKIGMWASVLPGMAIVAGFAEYVAGNDITGDILNGSGLVGSFACAAAIIYGYIRHPSEIEADQVAQYSRAQIVKLTPLPGHVEPKFETLVEIDDIFKRKLRGL